MSKRPKKKAMARAQHGQNPPFLGFCGILDPMALASAWVIWVWESGSGSCALHSRPHLMLRVLNLDMSVVVRTTFCSVTFGAFENNFGALRF